MRSPRRVDPIAEELVTAVLEDRPDLSRYPEALWAWGRSEARCLLFDSYLQDHEPWSEEGLKVAGWVHRVESSAQRMRERLGLDPKAESELARERAEATHASFDLEKLRERGREVIAARAVEVPGVGPVAPAEALDEDGDPGGAA